MKPRQRQPRYRQGSKRSHERWGVLYCAPDDLMVRFMSDLLHRHHYGKMCLLEEKSGQSPLFVVFVQNVARFTDAQME